MGQHVNITIKDYSASKLCTSVHEFIQITDGNSNTQMFDMCGQESTHSYISTTHRVEIIFSGHYNIQEENAFSVFLVKYESKCSNISLCQKKHTFNSLGRGPKIHMVDYVNGSLKWLQIF